MPFKKGQSGNPGGRSPRRDDERRVQLLARKHTDRAISKLASLIDAEDGRIAAIAASALLDRGWGKPSQHVEKQVTHIRRSYAERLAHEATAAPDNTEQAMVNTVQ